MFKNLLAVTLVLTGMAFAQSVWDQYPPKDATPIETAPREDNVANPSPLESNDNSVYSQPVNKKVSHVEKKWYIGDSQATPEAALALLKTNPEAASELSTSKVFYYPALLLASAGGAAVGYGIVAWIDGRSNIGQPLTLGGLGAVGIAFLLAHFSIIYVASAIEIYNKSLGYETSLQVKVVPTPQGGVALAFAF